MLVPGKVCIFPVVLGTADPTSVALEVLDFFFFSLGVISLMFLKFFYCGLASSL